MEPVINYYFVKIDIIYCHLFIFKNRAQFICRKHFILVPLQPREYTLRDFSHNAFI